MTNPELYPHETAYTQLAAEYSLDPSEVEHAARTFGNDFASLELALSAMEETDYED